MSRKPNDVENDVDSGRRDVMKAFGGAPFVGGLALGLSANTVSATGDVTLGSTVYVGVSSGFGSDDGNDGAVIAVDAASGDVSWQFTDPDDAVVSSPTVVDGTVYVGSHDGLLYALNAETGGVRWKHDTADDDDDDGEIHASPTIVDETVYIVVEQGTGSTELMALDAASGVPKWTYDELGGSNRSSPTVVDGTVYTGTSKVFAIYADSGDEKWTFETSGGLGGRVSSSPTVSDGTVIAGEDGGWVYGIDAESGEEQWSEYHESDSSPTVADGIIYMGANNQLEAYDVETGERLWFTSPDGGAAIESSPTVAGGTVYVGDTGFDFGEGFVFACDASDGTMVWVTEISDSVRSSPTVFDGTVYVGSENGNLYALDAEDGTEAWATGINLEDAKEIIWSSPTIVSDPAGGDSVGSRVNLGTLGHHHEWAVGDILSTIAPVGSFENPPQDLDGDGLYEDINGDGSADIVDVQALYQHLEDDVVQDHSAKFNFSGADEAEVTEADVEALYVRVSGGGFDD